MVELTVNITRKRLALGLLFVLLLSACGGETMQPIATPQTTAVSLPIIEPTATVAFSLIGEEAPEAADEHSHPLNSPKHLHLDDGSVLITEGLPIEDELFVQLLSGDPIAVSPANANVQTVVLTIPALF